MTAAVPALRRTPLYEEHRALGARFIPFAGWEMPLEYAGGGVLAEHRAVRAGAGLFDVSHMGTLRVSGPGAAALVQRALTNDAASLAPGRACYSPMCRADGGTLDDLIAYRVAPDAYLLVVNAANRERDRDWLRSLGGAAVADETEGRALLALQGPAAAAVLAAAGAPEAADLRPFGFREGLAVAGVACLVSRTGYTGEDGFEIACPAPAAAAVWRRLLAEGAVPCGLGARDTLRLEAALPLYGHELREDVNPYEAGLGRFVRLEKGEFVGREALRQVAAAGPRRRLVGLELRERGGIPRAGYPVLAGGEQVGAVTSGAFAPTLGRPVALALVAAEAAAPGTALAVAIRGRAVAAAVVPLPFYRRPRAG